MNLTNFDKTSLHLVQETVKRLAAQHGLTVTRAELIGMIPQKALTDAAKWYLQLHDLDDLLILENKLAQVAAQEPFDSGIGTFINAVASSDPAPGGGAVAALAGALAASLAQMVAGLTVGRKKYAAVNDQAQAVLDGAEGLRAQLTTAIAEDAAAFVAVMAAFRDKSVGEDQRAAAIEDGHDPRRGGAPGGDALEPRGGRAAAGDRRDRQCQRGQRCRGRRLHGPGRGQGRRVECQDQRRGPHGPGAGQGMAGRSRRHRNRSRTDRHRNRRHRCPARRICVRDLEKIEHGSDGSDGSKRIKKNP